MRPSALLRALRARVSSSPVSPWPVKSSFDQWLTVELDALRTNCESQVKSYTSSQWLAQALDIAIGTQKMAIESLANNGCPGTDRKFIEEYLDDIVELLDVCEALRERMEVVQKYIDSLKIVLHCLEGTYEPNATMLARATTALDSCEAVERRCSDLDKCNSDLRKLGEKLAQRVGCGAKLEASICNTELADMLIGSKAIASFACGVLGISLSFRSRRGLPSMQSSQTTCWSSSLHEFHKEVKEVIDRRRKSSNVVLVELSEAVHGAKKLRELITSKGLENCIVRGEDLRENVESLRKSCADTDQGIKLIEGKINQLYRDLISIRMALLGVISDS